MKKRLFISITPAIFTCIFLAKFVYAIIEYDLFRFIYGREETIFSKLFQKDIENIYGCRFDKDKSIRQFDNFRSNIFMP